MVISPLVTRYMKRQCRNTPKTMKELIEVEYVETENIEVIAALLTLVISRAIPRALVDHAEEQDDDCVFPTECWATILRSVAQLLLMETAASYDTRLWTSESSCIGKPNNRLRHD